MHLLSLLQQQFLLLYWFIPFSKQTCPNVAHLLRNSRMSFLLPLFFLTPLPSRLLKNSCLGLLAPPPRFLVFLQPASVEFSAVTSRGSAGSSEQVAGLAAVGGCTGSEGGSGDGDNGDSRGQYKGSTRALKRSWGQVLVSSCPSSCSLSPTLSSVSTYCPGTLPCGFN